MNEKWRSGIAPGETAVASSAGDVPGPAPAPAPSQAPRSTGHASLHPADPLSFASAPAGGDIAHWGWRPVWRPAHAASAYDPATELDQVPAGPWLVFEDATGIGAALCRRLVAAGHRVVRVTPGDDFAEIGPGRYTLASEPGRAGYDALLSALAEAGQSPTRIAHLWSLTAADPAGADPGFYHHVMEYGFYSLTYLAQALAAAAPAAPIHIVAVTRDATDAPGAPPSCPAGATLAGPALAMARELSGVSCTIVDIEGAARSARGHRRFVRRRRPDPDTLALKLLDDLLAPASETVAYRDDGRFRQVFRPVALEAAASPAFRDGGTYLITGGFGRAGLAVARGLVASHGATVVLVSRRVMPPREEWDVLRRRGGADTRVAAAMAAVEALETLGGSVEIAAADVTDIGAMQALTALVKRRHGRIDGVIHAAGVTDTTPLTRLGPPRIDRLLAPKIEGLRVLDRLCSDGSLDLMLLFGNVDTATGHTARAGTVAADRFLHAFAQGRQGGATRVVALDWGAWSGPGNGIDIARHDGPTAPLLAAQFTASDGVRMFRTTLETREHWLFDQYRLPDGPALLPACASIELAAEALALAAGAPAFEIRDFALAVPVAATGGSVANLCVRLTPTGAGWGVELLSGCPVDGPEARVTHARARVAPLATGPRPALDLAAIAPRCLGTVASAPEPGHLALPQAAHLALGPAWHSLRDSALGATEGLARLVLPEAARTTLAPGLLLHPALLDAAVGWALALAPGHDPDSLYTPDSADAIRVFDALPAEVASWARCAAEPATRDVAVFDVTLAALDGTVLVEIDGLRMHRRDPATWPMPASTRDRMTFIAAQPTAGAAFADGQGTLGTFGTMGSKGIAPDDALEALERALALGLAQVVISPGDPMTPAAPEFTTARSAPGPVGAPSSHSGNSQAADAAE